ETNHRNGLVRDKTRKAWPASIAAVGMALAADPVGVERGFLTRKEAVRRTLTVLRFLWRGPQGRQPDATGYKGFYYHFLDMETGRRAHRSELSTVDTTLLLAGALTAAAYFQHDNKEETEIRKLADALYRRREWPLAAKRGASGSHGPEPARRRSKYRGAAQGEGPILYIPGLGSPNLPTHL